MEISLQGHILHAIWALPRLGGVGTLADILLWAGTSSEGNGVWLEILMVAGWRQAYIDIKWTLMLHTLLYRDGIGRYGAWC